MPLMPSLFLTNHFAYSKPGSPNKYFDGLAAGKLIF